MNPDQKIGRYKTLNLLNSHEDPSFLHTVLYSWIARSYIPAPKANLVRVVINGESWGVYVNAQQFDKTFLAENGVTGSGGRAGRSGVTPEPTADCPTSGMRSRSTRSATRSSRGAPRTGRT